ncbi:hypothetical protein O7606_27445 [Micromonospora sp. WMMD882]|uniref:hypothetical protein n=1 Tax=Micromonospora sp. WMMD882 TaxID=3015151 RepID=UPI00248B594C|nr:hypothetical protein [Micromonospora sp. WMMD882]WBB79814.1 hypothetical protein O7606_27445 [Micromonospora sp. WMMD882]
MNVGFREALTTVVTRIGASVVVAALGAAGWTALADGSFTQRFGWLVGLAGIAAALPPSGPVTRARMMDVYRYTGRAPDAPYRDRDDGQPGLTRFGVFLFVTVPLLVVALWLG